MARSTPSPSMERASLELPSNATRASTPALMLHVSAQDIDFFHQDFEIEVLVDDFEKAWISDFDRHGRLLRSVGGAIRYTVQLRMRTVTCDLRREKHHD